MGYRSGDFVIHSSTAFYYLYNNVIILFLCYYYFQYRNKINIVGMIIYNYKLTTTMLSIGSFFEKKR